MEKKLQADKPVVSVVEIGSRAIRLLVAQIDSGTNLSTLYSKSYDSHLYEALPIGNVVLAREVEHLIQRVISLLDESERFEPDHKIIFATEAVRQLPHVHKELLLSSISGLEILSDRQELEYSFGGAVAGLPGCRVSDQLLLLDQGGGSMEIGVGSLITGSAVITDYQSNKLGTNRLYSLLSECEFKLDQLYLRLEQETRNLNALKYRSDVTSIAVGGVVNSLCWLSVSKGPNEKFDATRVHGKTINAKKTRQFANFACNSPARARALLEAKGFYGERLLRTLAGIVGLAVTFDALELEQIYVSVYGPRYGAALSAMLRKCPV